MAQFTFKLQPVLRQRKLIEESRQRDVAAAEAQRAAIARELQQLEEAVQSALTELREHRLTGVLNLAYLAGHRRFMLAMQRQGASIAQKLEEAKKKVDAERAKLAEASKQRRIIEKLREHQHTAWTEAVNRKETAALDEVAMQMSSEQLRQQWADVSLENQA
jgi:flagellar FliJ protein